MGEPIGEQFSQAFGEIVARHFPEMLRRQPNYRYYESKKGHRYGWTTERVNGKFSAFIYRRIKTKNQLKLVKQCQFAKRKVAKERAWKWFLKENPEKG